MYDLMKSENDSARACSPSSIRVVSSLYSYFIVREGMVIFVLSMSVEVAVPILIYSNIFTVRHIRSDLRSRILALHEPHERLSEHPDLR